jgi:hypothetical protein
MNRLIALAVLILALAGSTFAVDMHCTKPHEWETVCKVSDGSVNVVSDFRDSHGRGDYYDDWYTAEEWLNHVSPELMKQKAQQAQDEATQRLCDKGDITKENCDAYFAQHKRPAKTKDTPEECRKNYAIHPWYITKEDGTQVIDVGTACPAQKRKSIEEVCKELPAGANGCPATKKEGTK